MVMVLIVAVGSHASFIIIARMRNWSGNILDMPRLFLPVRYGQARGYYSLGRTHFPRHAPRLNGKEEKSSSWQPCKEGKVRSTRNKLLGNRRSQMGAFHRGSEKMKQPKISGRQKLSLASARQRQ